ncbi:MAG: hypothetical protein ABI548_02790 [Polyangiaceae bacterium]
MSAKLIELSQEDLTRKIRGTAAERKADSILNGKGWYKVGDENGEIFVLRGSSAAEFLRRRAAGSSPTVTPTPDPVPLTRAAAPAPAPAPPAAAAAAPPASQAQHKRSAILANANANARAKAGRSESAPRSILDGADAFAERQRAARARRQQESLNEGTPKGAA